MTEEFNKDEPLPVFSVGRFLKKPEVLEEKYVGEIKDIDPFRKNQWDKQEIHLTLENEDGHTIINLSKLDYRDLTQKLGPVFSKDWEGKTLKVGSKYLGKTTIEGKERDSYEWVFEL